METQITLSNKDYPSLNVLMRTHWAKRKKFQEKLQWIIKSQTSNRHMGKVVIRIQRHAIQMQDIDNLIGGFKNFLDALRKNGVITEDNPNIVSGIMPEFIMVSKRKDEKTVIKISDV